MIINHYCGLKPTETEILIGECWNKGMKLREVVNKYPNMKNKAVYYWKKFHCMVGYGNKVTHLYGVKKDLSKCSEDWLNHHGYTTKNNH